MRNLSLVLLAACATTSPTPPKGGPRGLRASEHRDLARQLERRLLIQRVARTFSVDTGEYVVSSRVTIPVYVGVQVDIRAAIYSGMRMNVSQQRITRTLHRLGGSRFILQPGARDQLAAFELGEDEQIVIAALHAGTSLAELTALHRELDPRMIEALLCTLAVCEAVTVTDLPGRTPTPQEPAPMPRAPTLSAVPMLIRADPTVARPPLPHARLIARGTRDPATKRTLTEPSFEGQPTRMRPEALTPVEVAELIEVGTALLERGVDHFSFLGLSFEATVEEVREAYLEFARYLRPEKLTELGIAGDQAQDAHGVFAQVVIAYTVLTDPVRRAQYLAAAARHAHR
jgi:hypothetical protein